MTQDDVLRMAREAGFGLQRDEYLFVEMLERFAALVAAAEREVCAKVCENIGAIDGTGYGIAECCAEAIRARGES